MRVLIAYASAGAGHRRAAEALYDYLKNNRKDLELELVDILGLANPFFRFCYNRGYIFLVHYTAWLWGFFFWVTEFRLTRWFSRKFSIFINYLGCRKFTSFLIKKEFDFIVSTHFLTSELASRLKGRSKIKSKLITIITDFGVHQFWLSKDTDIYIAASKATKDKLLALGVEESRVEDSGIPSAASFLKDQDRSKLASKLGIDPEKFTVLIMTGSFGVGPLEQITLQIRADAQVLLVCAKNEKLFSRLQKRNLENVKVFGFVHNAQELMAVSDIIITKPGGSSIAELLNMGLLPIFISAIPGQEEENIRILAAYGVGCVGRNIKQIKELVVQLKDNPQKLKSLKMNIARLAKPSACREISSVIR